MSLEEVKRGARAQEILDNPIFKEAMQAFDTEITNQWKQSPLRDVEGREKLRLMLEANRVFLQFIQTTMETGKLASLQPPKKGLLARVVGQN
jgi:hypothetical protein